MYVPPRPAGLAFVRVRGSVNIQRLGKYCRWHLLGCTDTTHLDLFTSSLIAFIADAMWISPYSCLLRNKA